jgi:lipopolysaccharide transport system ATP-binding protein
MAAPIISVRNLGKRYQLGAALQHDTLRDQLTHLFKNVSRPPGGKTNGPEFLQALNDVSFDVQPGEVIGIIGRNGAGKSTLLKILSQITEPTAGEIRVKGRIASLLEVGTGFHPELSGRENIFLNGAILGMTKAEIKAKFDEIVAFAEVDKFLDTPVKRYSSGMYVRLAFAVAAHLEPEILVIDEVLAVGDVQFQKRCLGKMAAVAKSGRTVLFVSHNLAAVQKLCSRALLLEAGALKLDGRTEDCIARYLQGDGEAGGDVPGFSISRKTLEKQSPGAPLRITNLEFLDCDQNPLRHLNTNEGLALRLHYLCSGQFARGTVSFLISLKTTLGLEVCRVSTMPISGYPIDELGRTGHLDLKIESLPLVGGRYLIDLTVFRPGMDTILQLPELATFEITPTDVYNSGVGMDQTRGLFVVKHRWHHQIHEAKDQFKSA